MSFLREKGVCFGCLCLGHFSKDCRKWIYKWINGWIYFTFLQRKEERKSEVAMDSTLVSSGLNGDDDYKPPIVPVQVKSKKASNATYGFLDQGSTAVFCIERLMYKLRLTGKRACILLWNMGPQKVVSSHIVSGLEVAGLQGQFL